MFPRNQICLLIGTPRGFTRSVLEALLKRGSRVILACPDPAPGHSEHTRLSGLYGSGQISVSVVGPGNVRALESLLIRALDTHGGVTCILNSTADDKLKVQRSELRGRVESVDRYLNRKQQNLDINSIHSISKLAVKYLGKQNGFSGGSLLNLTSSTELYGTIGVKKAAPAASGVVAAAVNRFVEAAASTAAATDTAADTKTGQCTVLGTTRGLGLSQDVNMHGVKVSTVYRPDIDYQDLSPAAQITDDQHSPYYRWNRYTAYCREYTGYMALHVADNASSGTAWRFNSELRLEQVEPEMLPNSCKIANKMCYWLGCPHVPCLPGTEGAAADLAEAHRPARQQESVGLENGWTQERGGDHVTEEYQDS